jgi:hypothetical protein
MATTRKHKDANQLAKSILDQAIGEVTPEVIDLKKKAAQENGRLGGVKGGQSRAKALTDMQRSEIAQLAAVARWKKS